jgi:hypothetical protein
MHVSSQRVNRNGGGYIVTDEQSYGLEIAALVLQAHVTRLLVFQSNPS